MDLSTFFVHTATAWAPGNNDGYGKVTFINVVPRQFSCRWEPTDKLFRDKQGREHRLTAMVYSTASFEVGTKMVLGTVSGPTKDPVFDFSAIEVRMLKATPSLDGTQTLYRYSLG